MFHVKSFAVFHTTMETVNIGIYGGAKGADTYWIVNTRSAGRACISPTKFICTMDYILVAT